MPVTINGTTGIAVVDGTAGTPAVQGTDTNTGIFFPAADTVAISAGGTEDFRIGPAGQIGLQGANYGSSGQVLRSNGSAAAPTWATLSSFTMPSGAIMPYAGSSAPTDWLLCSGAAVSRTTYAALFAVVGTTYGSGDGSTTFNLPDLRGRSAFGVDNMGGTAANRITSGGSGITGTTLGASGGAETVTLSTTQIPSHSHGFVNGGSVRVYPPGGTSAPTNTSGSQQNTDQTSTTSTGGGGAHNTVPPAIILNYIIKT